MKSIESKKDERNSNLIWSIDKNTESYDADHNCNKMSRDYISASNDKNLKNSTTKLSRIVNDVTDSWFKHHNKKLVVWISFSILKLFLVF